MEIIWGFMWTGRMFGPVWEINFNISQYLLWLYIQGILAIFCLQRDIYRKTKPHIF